MTLVIPACFPPLLGIALSKTSVPWHDSCTGAWERAQTCSIPAEEEPCPDLHTEHRQYLLLLLVQSPSSVVVKSRRKEAKNVIQKSHFIHPHFCLSFFFVLFPCGQEQANSRSNWLGSAKQEETQILRFDRQELQSSLDSCSILVCQAWVNRLDVARDLSDKQSI